jgi:hypothetical protein
MNSFPVIPALPMMHSQSGVHGAVGDIWYQGASGFWIRLTIPADWASVNYVLGIVAGVPSWIPLDSITSGGFGTDFGNNFGND